MGKRIIALYLTMVVLFCGVMMRVYQLCFSEDLTRAATQQSTYTVDVATTRGAVYDCRGERMTDREKEYAAVVSPQPEAAAALAEAIVGPDRTEVLEQLRQGVPFLCMVGKSPIESLGILSVPIYSRYGSHPNAVHILGYLDREGKGVSGIERAFEEQLSAAGEEVSVRYGVDVVRNPLDSIPCEQRGNSAPPECGVMLTLDREIQEIVDTVTRQQIKKGAVVVMDVQNGDIKASSSMPTFSPYEVEKSLDDKDSPFLNRAFCRYNVGSTFKLCVAAAALEKGITPDFSVTCVGGVEIDGRMVRCHNWAGHGAVAMKEAIEDSCNPYFIALGKETGAENIIAMGEAMGFGKESLFAPGVFSASGNLPKVKEITNDLALANLSFGQGTLMATPVQVAAMVSSIANGGTSVTPRLVKGWTDDGITLREEAQFAKNRIFSKDTAQKLQDFMIGVVEEGSGTRGKPKLGGAGGKTASAQTGTYDEFGKEIVHAWFAGFFPADQPRYAMVVFVEGGEYGGQVASPIFKRIADQIAVLERERGKNLYSHAKNKNNFS